MNDLRTDMEKFIEKQGGQESEVFAHNRVLYPNGAQREDSQRLFGWDPPSDERARERNILLYWQSYLQQKVLLFDQTQRNFKHMGMVDESLNTVPPPQISIEQAERELLALKGQVEKAREEIAKCEARLEDLVPDRERVKARMNLENRERRAALKEAVERIQI